MQTERVTFLTTPDHKAALDAFAAGNGMSVGHVVREATSRYLSVNEMDEEAKLALLVQELGEVLPKMHEALDRALERSRRTGVEIERKMRDAGLWT